MALVRYTSNDRGIRLASVGEILRLNYGLFSVSEGLDSKLFASFLDKDNIRVRVPKGTVLERWFRSYIVNLEPNPQPGQIPFLVDLRRGKRIYEVTDFRQLTKFRLDSTFHFN